MYKKKYIRKGRRSLKSQYQNAFRPKQTQMSKEPGLAYIRRTFTNVAVLPYYWDANTTYIKTQGYSFDLHYILGQCAEYNNVQSAYKFVSMKNLKVIIHQQHNDIGTNSTPSPIVIAYDGSKTGHIDVVNQDITVSTISAAITNNYIPNAGNSNAWADTHMRIAKSKMISTSPDYFVCSMNNAEGRLRELSTPVGNNGSGKFGFMIIQGLQPLNQQKGTVWCTIQIIFDVLLYEQ